MTFTPTFGSLTSGQIQIPAGVRSFTITVVSGFAYANGTLLLPSTPWTISMGDSKLISSVPINLGATGVSGVGVLVNYLYAK